MTRIPDCLLREKIGEGECPYILPGEEELRENRELRIRRKCLYCKRLLDLILDERDTRGFLLKVALEELREKDRIIRDMKGFLKLQKEQITVLHRVSEVLNLSLDLREIAYVVLLSITAGELFGFNRSILLLYDRETRRFTGYFGMGPRTPEEAVKIWEEIERERKSFPMLLESFTIEKFEEEKKKFLDILQALETEIDEGTEAFIFGGKGALLIRKKGAEFPFFRKIFDVLRTPFYVLLPLKTKEGPIGVIIADNFVTGLDIEPERTESLEIFAYQASLAIHRAALHRYLEDKLKELEELNAALKQYNEKMAKMEKMAAVGEIIHHITHEFKNPLIVIGGLSKELLKETDSSDARHRYLMAISEEVERLLDILNRTVEDARRRFSVRREPVDINSLLESRLREYAPLFKAKNIEVNFHKDEAVPPVMADPSQIQVCFDNVIFNAIEAMPEGGRLDIKSERNSGGSIRISFKDTGIGMSEDVMKRIFEPYFTTKKKGSGLGLYNTKEIMKAHGGDIKVESQEGEGTTVYLIFTGGEHGGEGKEGEDTLRR